MNPTIRKIILCLAGLVLLVLSGIDFYQSRRLPEPVVLGNGVTQVQKLSSYFPAIGGTANDCNIYVLEGKEPGATLCVLGGTHPEEPAGQLAPWLVVENATVQKGRLIVALSASRSATTVTRPSGPSWRKSSSRAWKSTCRFSAIPR